MEQMNYNLLFRRLVGLGFMIPCRCRPSSTREPGPVADKKTIMIDVSRGTPCVQRSLRKYLKAHRMASSLRVEKGIRACIPGRKNRKKAVRYKRRNHFEIMFARPEDWKRVATRCDRCPIVFLSATALAATVFSWLCRLMGLEPTEPARRQPWRAVCFAATLRYLRQKHHLPDHQTAHAAIHAR